MSLYVEFWLKFSWWREFWLIPEYIIPGCQYYSSHGENRPLGSRPVSDAVTLLEKKTMSMLRSFCKVNKQKKHAVESSYKGDISAGWWGGTSALGHTASAVRAQHCSPPCRTCGPGLHMQVKGEVELWHHRKQNGDIFRSIQFGTLFKNLHPWTSLPCRRNIRTKENWQKHLNSSPCGRQCWSLISGFWLENKLHVWKPVVDLLSDAAVFFHSCERARRVVLKL